MVDILQQAGELTGIGGGGSGGIAGGLLAIIIIVALIVFLLVGFGAWFFIRWYQYKFTIKIFEKINGQFVETAKKKARIFPVGKGGEQALLLNKPKKLLPMPSLKSGKNTFNYFISEDGEWINFVFGDFDEDRREVGSQFLDKEMRYSRTSLQALGDERYDQKGFWEKYSTVIITIGTLLVAGIVLFLMADKLVELSQSSAAAVESSAKVLDRIDQLLGKMDNIAQGGQGYKPLN